MTDLIKDMFNDIFSSSAFDSVAEVLKLNPEQEYAAAWAAVEFMYTKVMVPIALGLMIIWFLVKFMERATNEHMTLESLLMLFAQLFVCKFLIDHGLQIFADLWSLGISVIDQVSAGFETIKEAHGATGGDPGFALSTLWKDFTGVDYKTGDIGIIAGIGLLCQMLIPWLVSKAMIACTYFICYSRLLEMFVRMLSAPIALSDFMSEGLHGAGWKYLKGFLAICLQGMFILCICELYSMIMAGVFTGSETGFWSTLLEFIALGFAAIALMFKSLSLSKELLGAT